MKTTYTVLVTDNYEGNKGECEVQKFTFTSFEEAEAKYDSLISEEVEENGVMRLVELYSGNVLENQLQSDFCKSVALPEDGIIVYFNNHKYMGYSYDIREVVAVAESGCKTREDLPYSADSTSAVWAIIFDNIAEFNDAWEKKCYPFDKMNSGQRIAEEFYNSLTDTPVSYSVYDKEDTYNEGECMESFNDEDEARIFVNEENAAYGYARLFYKENEK